MKVMIIPGLTLPQVSDADLERIRQAAGSDTSVSVCKQRQAPERAAEVEVILGMVPRALFRAASKLRWVHAIASGVDSFLYPEFIESPVILTSEKGLVGEHLADHAFGLLLMLTRQLATAYAYGPDCWNHRPQMRGKEIELTGATMGIFGFGGTGRAMARRASAFGMRCAALDRDNVPPSAEVTTVWAPDRLDRLLQESDVFAVCCPLTNETRNFLNADRLARLRPSAILVNVTRGEVMVEDALISALKGGRLAGAALDVAPREPLPESSELWRLDNVVMTPHTAGASQFRASRNIDRFVTNLSRLRAGEALDGVIDKIAGY